MDPRVLFFVVTFGSCGLFINLVITNPISAPEKTAFDIKFLLDCMHSDNETYTACFKREKGRLHSQNIDHSCMKSCLEDCRRRTNQVYEACEDNCNHCIKKVKQINIADVEMEVLRAHENYTNNRVKREEAKHVNVNVDLAVDVHNHVYSSPTKPQCPCFYIILVPCYCRPWY